MKQHLSLCKQQLQDKGFDLNQSKPISKTAGLASLYNSAVPTSLVLHLLSFQFRNKQKYCLVRMHMPKGKKKKSNMNFPTFASTATFGKLHSLFTPAAL